MSQQSDFLDDSDLEDEAFLLELEQQVISRGVERSHSVSVQEQQLRVILCDWNRSVTSRQTIQRMNQSIDKELETYHSAVRKNGKGK